MIVVMDKWWYDCIGDTSSEGDVDVVSDVMYVLCVHVISNWSVRVFGKGCGSLKTLGCGLTQMNLILYEFSSLSINAYVSNGYTWKTSYM